MLGFDVTPIRLLCAGDCWLIARVNSEARKIVQQLGLEPLPHEGGFFRATWQSEARLASGRAASSAIWFLLTPDDFSAWHRLKPEELWHFHAGDPIEHVQLDPKGRTLRINVLGADVMAGQQPQLVVAGEVWQAARVVPTAVRHGWSLVGCTVTPAWDPEEFELATRAGLRREFPGEEAWIVALTR